MARLDNGAQDPETSRLDLRNRGRADPRSRPLPPARRPRSAARGEGLRPKRPQGRPGSAGGPHAALARSMNLIPASIGRDSSHLHPERFSSRMPAPADRAAMPAPSPPRSRSQPPRPRGPSANRSRAAWRPSPTAAKATASHTPRNTMPASGRRRPHLRYSRATSTSGDPIRSLLSTTPAAHRAAPAALPPRPARRSSVLLFLLLLFLLLPSSLQPHRLTGQYTTTGKLLLSPTRPRIAYRCGPGPGAGSTKRSSRPASAAMGCPSRSMRTSS